MANVGALNSVASRIIWILERKDQEYGESWKDGGGKSAFENLNRKWSRLRVAVENSNMDVFEAIRTKPAAVDSLADLVGYALLTLAEFDMDLYVDDEAEMKLRRGEDQDG